MTNTLIPFWDMANHDNGEMSTDFNDDSDSTVCMAQKDFEPGQQFTIFYGVRANIDLLVHNGFVFEANNEDCLTLKLGLSKNDSLALQKLAFLEELNIPRTGLFFIGPLTKEKPLDPALLAFLRVLCMTSTDLEEHKDAIKKLLENDNNNLSELDKRVYGYLQTRCQLLLKSYPTDLQEDLELLKTRNPSQKFHFAVLLRSKEKVMLQGAINYCQSILTTCA